MNVSVDMHCKINLNLFIFICPICVSSFSLRTVMFCMTRMGRNDCNESEYVIDIHNSKQKESNSTQ